MSEAERDFILLPQQKRMKETFLFSLSETSVFVAGIKHFCQPKNEDENVLYFSMLRQKKVRTIKTHVISQLCLENIEERVASL